MSVNTNNSLESLSSLGLSPEQLTMAEQIERAPADQKEALFNKLTREIGSATKTKLRALLLGASIAMGTAGYNPAMAADQVQDGVRAEVVDGSVMNNPEYRTLLSSVDVEFPRFVEMGRSEVSSGNMDYFIARMDHIKNKLKNSDVAGKIPVLLVKKGIIEENGKLYKELVAYIDKFDKYAKVASDEVVAQNYASIKQSEESIKQSEESIKQSEESIKEIKKAQKNLQSINKAFSNN